MNMTRFAAYIKAEREARNWSQVELARRIDRDQPWLSDIESGVRTTPVEHEDFEAMARVFRVDITDLYRAAGYINDADLAPPEGLTFHAWIGELDDVRDLPDEAKEGFKTLARLVNRREGGTS